MTAIRDVREASVVIQSPCVKWDTTGAYYMLFECRRSKSTQVVHCGMTESVTFGVSNPMLLSPFDIALMSLVSSGCVDQFCFSRVHRLNSALDVLTTMEVATSKSNVHSTSRHILQRTCVSPYRLKDSRSAEWVPRTERTILPYSFAA